MVGGGILKGAGTSSSRKGGDPEFRLCVQQAGDIAYVPYGWAHAVFNLETVVGVAVEFEAAVRQG